MNMIAIEGPRVGRAERIIGYVGDDEAVICHFRPDKFNGDRWSVRVFGGRAGFRDYPSIEGPAADVIAWVKGHGCDRVEAVVAVRV